MNQKYVLVYKCEKCDNKTVIFQDGDSEEGPSFGNVDPINHPQRHMETILDPKVQTAQGYSICGAYRPHAIYKLSHELNADGTAIISINAICTCGEVDDERSNLDGPRPSCPVHGAAAKARLRQSQS